MRFNIRLLIIFVTIFTLFIGLFIIFQHQTSTDYILTMELETLSERGVIIKNQLDSYLLHASVIVKQLSLNREIIEFIRDKQYADTKSIHQLLDDIRATNSYEISVVFLMDEDGICRASTDRRFNNTDYSFRPYFKNLVDGRRNLFISDYSIGLRSLIPGVFLSTPVKNDDGSLDGVVVLKIAGSYLQEMLELNTAVERDIFDDFLGHGRRRIRHISIPARKPDLFIINKDGIVIFHTKKELLYRSLTPLEQETIEELDLSQQFLGRQIPSMDEFVLGELHNKSLISQKATATVYRDAKLEKWKVLVITPMDHFSWSVCISLDYEDFKFLSKALLTRTMLLMLITLTVLYLTSFYITRMVTRPITILVEAISHAKDGDWNKRVKIHEKNEFGYLANRFNELLDIIESYSGEMEQKVESRTREVIALQRENTRLRIFELKEQLYTDLHDSIGAKLTNINICNTVATNELSNNTAMVEDMLKRIDTNCEVAIKEMRQLLRQNNNPDDPEPLLGRDMLNRIRNRLMIQSIKLNDDVNVPPGIFYDQHKHHIKEILEELVTNVLKHSNADNVYLYARVEEGEIVLKFSDDGKGMLYFKNENSFGIRNINKRLKSLGGHLEWNSTPEHGVHYIITIPIPEKREDVF